MHTQTLNTGLPKTSKSKAWQAGPAPATATCSPSTPACQPPLTSPPPSAQTHAEHSVHSVHYRKLRNGKNAVKDQAVGSEKSPETLVCTVQKHVSFEALLGLQQFEKQVRLLSHACCALRHQTRWLELLAVHRTFGHLELFERGLEASSRCAIFKVWQAGMDERRRSVLRKSDGASSDAFVTVLSHDGVQLAFCLI